MEVLSPAGSMEALQAAVQNGADAVYLGGTQFNARGSAANFSGEGLCEAVEYAHLYGARVYLTLNTLVRDEEWSALETQLRQGVEASVDALIVQDIGVARFARQHTELPLHASTQLSIHNAQSAELLREIGFTRVVAARECSARELRAMTRAGMQVEAFVHGALCVSVSGQCLCSSLIGGRSGNRGACAQPCRLEYRANDGTRGALLSPKDICLIDDLATLRASGVQSLKIEGRMKRPEYVAITTRCYREALDALERGEAYDSEAARDELLRVYNRGGFCRGYIDGVQDALMMEPARVRHAGVRLGSVLSVMNGWAQVRLTRALRSGDGLEGRNTDASEGYGVIASASGEAGERITLSVPQEARAGDTLYLTSDTEQLERARLSYRKPSRTLPIRGKAHFRIGEAPELALECGEVAVRCAGDTHYEIALSHALDESGARKQLEKLGGSAYRWEALDIEIEADGYYTSAQLNALRRKAVAALDAARLQAARSHAKWKDAPPLPAPERVVPEGAPQLIAQVTDAEQAAVCREWGIAVEWLPDDVCDLRAGKDFPEGAGLVVPQFLRNDALALLVKRLERSPFRSVTVGNIGHMLPFLHAGFAVNTGSSCNVFNARSAITLQALGARRIALSPELTLAQARGLCGQLSGALGQSAPEVEMTIYGRLPLMVLAHCPARAMRGLNSDREDCALCAQGKGARQLTLCDRKGAVFPLHPQHAEDGCSILLLNAHITNLAAHWDAVCASGVGTVRLQFFRESPEEVRQVVRITRMLLEGDADAAEALREWFERNPQHTAGHAFRGV